MKSLLLIVFSLCALLASARGKLALVVGISDYPQYKTTSKASWNAIHGANDAALISKTLKAKKYKVHTLTNRKATASNIRYALSRLVSEASTGDYIYLHFSCHGQPYEDADGDEDDGWDESIVPYDAQKTYRKNAYEGGNHIIDDELYQYYQKLRQAVGTNGLVCVVIDACHSGGSSRGEESSEDAVGETFIRGTKDGFSPNGKQFRPRINAKGHFHIAKVKGSANIVIIEACRSYQSNCEIRQSGRYYGPLSYYIDKVLQTKPISANTGWITEIKKFMDSDDRLSQQDMVYETSWK